MQVPSILHDGSLKGLAQSRETYEKIQTAEEERARANIDAVFEFACRLIVAKSLPEGMNEICIEHPQTVRPVFRAE